MLEEFLQTRTDRFIAVGRVAIAAFALTAIWFDQTQPARAPDVAYGLLVAYLAFAGLFLVASRQERVRSAEIALASHIVDLAVISSLMFLTEGPTSPFFPLFTFTLLSAAFRWQWKGALWTAVAVLVLLVVMAVVSRGLAPELAFEVDRFVIRCTHVVVIGAMLVYFGFRQQRSAEEAFRLAAWQPDPAVGADSRSLVEACLAHVANVFAAPRAVLVLQTRGESSPIVSVWADGTFEQHRLDGVKIEELVPAAVTGVGFIRREAGNVLVADEPGRLSIGEDSPTSPALAGYDLERTLSAPIHSEHATGRLFVTGKQDFQREELAIASLVAVQIGVLLDRLQVIEQAQEAAAAEERLHLARDLHDGILQTLAGSALQLETIKRLTDQDPDFVRAKMSEMQGWLLNEQREIRAFIAKLRPAGPWIRSGLSPEHPDLPSLVRALEQQWGVTIALSAEAADLALPADIQLHVRHIVREAVANAVRHGGATDIGIRPELGEGVLGLTIADNGSGLPVHGQFDDRQCARDAIGPRSLRERIVGLGGTLVIDSSKAGLTLSIRVPLTNVTASDSDRSDPR